MKRTLRLPENKSGRDFIVGDIHGCFDLLDEAIKQAGFNPASDRLFSVGDLVDRGPYSPRCVEFLSRPYVFAVRGNHEDMFLSLYEHGEPHPAELKYATSRNGMYWWNNEGEAQQKEILKAFAKLPLVIEVETKRGSVGLIHAEVPLGMGWPEFIKKIEEGDIRTIDSCLWGRNRVTRLSVSGVSGIGRVFAGHTVMPTGITRLGNCYFVDGGAVFAHTGEGEGQLNVVNLIASTQVICAPKEHSMLIHLIDEEKEDTFSAYAAC